MNSRNYFKCKNFSRQSGKCFW